MQSSGLLSPGDYRGSSPCVDHGASPTVQRTAPEPSQLAVYISAMADSARAERIATHERNPKWQSAPLLIDMAICINCDTCIRHCPPQFGAIFNHGIDVVILPELCSGCGKCLPPVCPVNCIYEDPDWKPSSEDWWVYPGRKDDPYR